MESSPAAMLFTWPVRVYYEDTDHGGVVYHANYLKYMERARTELFRTQGVELNILQQSIGVIFAVRRSDVEYFSPAKFNDLLMVTTQVVKSSRVKFLLTQKIYSTETMKQTLFTGVIEPEPTENKLLVQADISVVSLCAKTLKPKRIPVSLLEELMREQ